jgi:hypothetical protein
VTGKRERTYTVITPASNNGNCPISPETETCTKTDCPVNCIGIWNQWSACDGTCNGINALVTGKRERTYTVITPASNNGNCPISLETETCTKTDCPVNCIVKWNDWTACDGTCDGINAISSIPGTRSRTFTVTTPNSNGGERCPISPEIDSKCFKTACLVKIVAITTKPENLVGLNPNQPSSGEKYIVFNYTSDNAGLIGQTEYTFNITSNNINARILIVGGGGGGAYDGGGGGGGDVSDNNITIPVGTHKIRVGKGGLGSTSISSAGGTGYNSELILQSGATYTYCGGGGGGGWLLSAIAGIKNAYSSGGGGGGAGGGASTRLNPTVTNGGSGNGFSGNGGNGGQTPPTKGGGGGAVGHGDNGGATGNGGIGGTGVTSNITGSNVGYGGGGGGGRSYDRTFSANGVDGGGNGGQTLSNYAVAGINGTGGGGGGGFLTGGNGGHGVIIIRYKA